jgi:hypothetical protein
VQSDGSIVTEKVTTYLNGRKSVEVTTTRKWLSGDEEWQSFMKVY